MTSCNPMDCSLPGFSVLGIFQARTLEWVAISFSRGSSRPRDRARISCIAGRLCTTEPPGKPSYSWVKVITTGDGRRGKKGFRCVMGMVEVASTGSSGCSFAMNPSPTYCYPWMNPYLLNEGTALNFTDLGFYRNVCSHVFVLFWCAWLIKIHLRWLETFNIYLIQVLQVGI